MAVIADQERRREWRWWRRKQSTIALNHNKEGVIVHGNEGDWHKRGCCYSICGVWRGMATEMGGGEVRVDVR